MSSWGTVSSPSTTSASRWSSARGRGRRSRPAATKSGRAPGSPVIPGPRHNNFLASRDHWVLELCPDPMGSRRNNLIILGMVVVLIGIAAYLIFIRQPVAQATQLGLDLEGGVSVQMEGYQTDGSQVTRDEMEQAVGVIQQRVNSLGVTEPEIQIQGQNQVIVNIPGITDQRRAVEVIGRTAQLGFYQVLAADGGQIVAGGEVEGGKEGVCEG